MSVLWQRLLQTSITERRCGMSKCRFLTPCGICEIKSMLGIPYTCDLMRTCKLDEEKMPIPKFVEDKTYTDMRGKEE